MYSSVFMYSFESCSIFCIVTQFYLMYSHLVLFHVQLPCSILCIVTLFHFMYSSYLVPFYVQLPCSILCIVTQSYFMYSQLPCLILCIVTLFHYDFLKSLSSTFPLLYLQLAFRPFQKQVMLLKSLSLYKHDFLTLRYWQLVPFNYL